MSPEHVKAATHSKASQTMTELPSSFLSLLNTVHPNQLKYMKRIIADRIANAPKATDYVIGKGLTNPSPVLNVTKLSEFHVYVYDKKPDIICLTETWLWG